MLRNKTLSKAEKIDPHADQLRLTDFRLYMCEVCGKMVMGFDRGNHAREVHRGKDVEWRKVK